jgi:hypothetical protein
MWGQKRLVCEIINKNVKTITWILWGYLFDTSAHHKKSNFLRLSLISKVSIASK